MNCFTTEFIDRLPEVDGFIFKADSKRMRVLNGIKIYPIAEIELKLNKNVDLEDKIGYLRIN